MLQRQSTLFLPTLREDPADAEAVSHKLLVRAGLIRQVGAGLWTYLPAGWRVHENVVQIVREEMNAIGGQEMSMPVLTPAELWQLSGRYDKFDSLMKIRDASGRDFVLSPTNEETVTLHARELRSYRDLPKILYHVQTKEREETRPRGGLIRVREFVMKDAYSFDRDEEGLERSFLAHKGAYEQIFERCGLETVAVEAESGMMGGSESVDFLAPSGSGENTLVTCERGDYAADLEIARGVPAAPDFPETLASPAEVETPGIETCESLAGFLGIDLAATSKAMPVVADGKVVLALVRGDDRLDEAKLAGVLGSLVRPAHPEEIREAFGAEPGSLGPVGFDGDVVVDETLREGQFVAGANRTGYHLRGVQQGRDFDGRVADIRVAREGDRCPNCGGTLVFRTAIEVGHIFKLGTFYSVPFEATYLDEQSVEHPMQMGCYGIGPGRVLAAIVEQRHDERGIVWPASTAPFDVHVLSLDGGTAEIAGLASGLAEELSAAGRSVLLDDRDARPGEKFADADLLGCPLRVTVGRKSLEDDSVDVRRRGDDADSRVPRASVIDWTGQD
ncbi:MAG TPA: proline--tRNA ligase [Gaiella sp.]|uniref:proline--tRNA ligase n=1 Tax=Gaiella sp. TaxID=2663207 RepID=UPI002D7F693C|nr:proline--tRNA ligase [Gaiella sp.]HET9288775.1 proline--tRNA ligase [Gaiella sp.]